MTCETYRDLVAAYIDGVLPLAERQEAEQHLHTCPQCHHLFTTASRFGAAFPARRLIVPVPAAVAQRLHTALAAEGVARPTLAERLSAFLWRPRFAFGLAAAVAFLVFLFPRLFPSTAVTPEFTQAAAYYQAATTNQLALITETTDPHQLQALLNRPGQLDFVTHVLDLRPAGYEISGGQIVGATEHPIALVLYEGKEGPIVCLRQRGMVPPMPASGQGLKGKYLYTHADYTIAFLQEAGYFCILISRLSPEAFQHRLQMLPAA